MNGIEKSSENFYNKVKELLEQAQTYVVQAVNKTM